MLAELHGEGKVGKTLVWGDEMREVWLVGREVCAREGRRKGTEARACVAWARIGLQPCTFMSAREHSKPAPRDNGEQW